MSDAGVMPSGGPLPQGDSDSNRRRPEPGSEEALAEILADFEAEVRQGHRPSVSVWARRYPEHSDTIQRLFPGVLLMEHTGQEWPQTAAPSPLPERVGPYPILRELGRGGMGVVYLAKDERLARQVALKVFQKYGATDQRFLERFFREARAAGRLNHPHIVPIFETGQEQGVPYYSMLYIEGPTLEQCLFELRRTPSSGGARRAGGDGRALWQRVEQRRPSATQDEREVTEPWALSWAECSRLCREVGSALAHAHERGILHRDVKPANILLDRRGHAWVNDFGLCHWKGEAAMTEEGEIVGTLKYMAPEQLEGEPDERSDVYGLGLVLYELVTRKEAFPETRRARLVRQITSVDPVRPRKIEPAIPKDLETIILKATAKLPDERYPSVQSFVRDLEAFEEGRPISARPPSTWYLALLLLKRQKLLAAVILFFLAASAVLTSLYLQSLRAEREQRTAGEYNARLTAAEAALHSAAVERGIEQLNLAPETHRGWEWYHLRARMDQSLAKFYVGEYYIRSVKYSRVSGHLAVAASPAGHILQEHAGSLEPIGSVPGNMNLALWGADGKEAYFFDANGEVRALPLDPSLSARTIGWAARQATEAAWIDEHRAVVGNDAGTIGVLDTNSGSWTVLNQMPGQVRILCSLAGGEVFAVDVLGNSLRMRVGTPVVQRGLVAGTMIKGGALHSKDRELIYAAGDGAVESRTLAGPMQMRRFPGGLPESKAIALSESRDRLAVVGMHRLVQQWVLSTKETLAPLQGHGTGVYTIDWSPDGERFATGDERGSVRVWHPRLRGGRMELGHHFYDITDIRFRSDGGQVLSSCRDGSISLWDLSSYLPIWTALGNGRPVLRSFFLSDDSLVLSVMTNGDLVLWDARTGRRVGSYSGESWPGLEPCRVALKPDKEGVCIARWIDDADPGTLWFEWSLDREDSPSPRVLEGHRVTEFVWDPTRMVWLAGTQVGELLVLREGDMAVIDRQRVPNEGQPIWWIEVDPATGLVAIGDWSRQVYVYDRGLENLPKILTHSGARIDHAQFIPGQARLVGGTRSGSVSVWSLQSGDHLCDIDTQTHWISHIACSPDGSRVISGSSHGGLWLYDHRSTLERVLEGPPGQSKDAPTRLESGRSIVLATLDGLLARHDGAVGAASLMSWTFSIRNEDVWEAGVLHAAMDLVRGQPQHAIAELRSIFGRAGASPELLQHARCLWVLAHLRLGDWAGLGEEAHGVAPLTLWRWKRALDGYPKRG